MSLQHITDVFLSEMRNLSRLKKSLQNPCQFFFLLPHRFPVVKDRFHFSLEEYELVNYEKKQRRLVVVRYSSMDSKSVTAATARLHVEGIRKRKFSIGQNQPNPLTQDLHHAVTSLSAELYTKDVHFLMELIQNAEDNEYLPGVEPTLEFVLTTTDITGSGAPATLLIFNNEVGFSQKNMDSMCSIGRSTKKGLRQRGFIGEKGIGFKSVFLVSARPHIFSNGYQVSFNELPNKDCGVGYIVPEWIENKPTVADIKHVYGTKRILPTTTIILPLKPEKVEAVKKQLSELHPEVLLFLSKIKRLSVRENNGDSLAVDSVSSIAISSETSLVSSRTKAADSRIVQLCVQEGADLTEATCRYFIWRQAFPVEPKNEVDARKDVKEWVISLAFPFGERLKRGTSSVGVFAFLPTAMVTNFPFIVQADFMLASSRETILLDNKWNLGILSHVPSSFVNAIIAYVKSAETTPWFVARLLEFLPTRESPFKELNRVRLSIRTMLQAESVILCESFSNDQRIFCRPTEAIRIFPEFRKILLLIKKGRVPLDGISSLGKLVLHTSLDRKEHDEVLDFIGVSSVDENYAWYGKCIQACNLMSQAPIEVYMELLFFFADKWKVLCWNLNSTPVLKYATWNGEAVSCSVSQIKRKALKVHLVLETEKHFWLNKWNLEMGCLNNIFFLSNGIVSALLKHDRQYVLREWLVSKVGVVVTSVSQHCSVLGNFIAERKEPKLAVCLAHLVYQSKLKHYIGTNEISELFRSMPIVDGCGKVHAWRTKTLVPSSGSKWAKLFGSNPFAGGSGNVKVECGETDSLDKYVDLGEVYGEAVNFAGESTGEKKLLDFLAKHTGALDLPDIPPLNLELEVAYSPLTSDQAILLLDWIRFVRAKGCGMPSRFIESIQNGTWMKTYLGFKSPNQCFLCNENEESTFIEMQNVLQLFPVVDQEFYSDRIKSYKVEMQLIGVQIGSENMYQLIIDHLQHRASFTRGREWAIFLLHFIRRLKVNYMLREDLLKTVKVGEWLKTNRGYNTPVGSIFPMFDVEAVLQITDLPVIDSAFYGDQIDCFAAELELLGVVIDLEGVLKLVPNNFRLPRDLTTLTRDSILLLLKCIKHLGPAAIHLTQKIREQPWMRTSSGLRCPSESLLPDKKWGHLLKVIPLPLISEDFYGSGLKSYKAELKAIGVVVDLDGVSTMLSDQLMSLLSSSSLTCANVISILNCMKCMGETMPSQMLELRNCLAGEKWLKTLHGYKSTSDSILFDSKWGTVAPFVDLPLVDEAFYGIGIYSYKDQLEMLGVVVDFSEGAQFVARGLGLPKEPAFMTADSAIALLQCVRALRINSSDKFLLEELLNKLRGSKWVKTHMGYRSPEESLLFDPEWECCLEKHDAPFIDESFYGNFISLEKDDLIAIGVKADTEEVCSLIFEILNYHTQSPVIMRIYKFLNRFKWNPKLQDGPRTQIWIPDQNGSGRGKWVDTRVCVLHNRDNLFHSRLHTLDKYYENELLLFLQFAFGVAEVPPIDDYLMLWNDWVSTRHEVAPAECCFFWEHISEIWNSVTEEILKKNISMLPANTISGEGVELVEKSGLFIPDDLQLKKLFTSATVKPLFVWYPEDNLSSLSPTKLTKIYESLGIQKISESIKFDPSCTLSVDHRFEVLDLKNGLIGKALIKIVLGFFANPRIHMPVEERHKIAKTLLDISVVLTNEPIEVSYSLRMPSLENILRVKTRRMVLWEKNSGRLIICKSSWNKQRNSIEFITDFARAISGGLLSSRTDHVDSLCKIIQMGFAFGFKEDAVDFLLMTENLELSVADTDFLSAAFPPAGELSSLIPLERLCLPGFTTYMRNPTRKRTRR